MTQSKFKILLINFKIIYLINYFTWGPYIKTTKYLEITAYATLTIFFLFFAGKIQKSKFTTTKLYSGTFEARFNQIRFENPSNVHELVTD